MFNPICFDRITHDNCNIYETDKDACKVCKSGYKLMSSDILPLNSFCIALNAQELVKDCAEYDGIINTCIKCEKY